MMVIMMMVIGEEWMDGWMDRNEWMDGLRGMDGEEWMERNGWMDGCIGMYAWLDGWIHREGWTDLEHRT